MGKERRVTREDAEDLMAQIRRATDAGAEEATVNVFGAQLVLSRQSDGGFTFQASDGSARSRFHPASDSRPSDYPDSVPFIPNEPVAISSTGNTVSLMWFTPADPDALFAELKQRTLSDGWTLKQESEFAHVPARHSEYETAESSRSILISGAMVSLIQKAPS